MRWKTGSKLKYLMCFGHFIGEKMLKIIFIFLSAAVLTSAQGTVSTPDRIYTYAEDWGYVHVRESAHVFWWLYSVPVSSCMSDRPLILWLQGGPGLSSTGFGNLDELGPKDSHLQDRNYTWLQVADLVFVDNPVGAGFSYVDDDSAFTTNVKQIGQDLVVWAKAFFKKHFEYQNKPFYILSESYGGKMSAEFAIQFQDAIDAGEIKANLAGVALGDSWTSPMDFINTLGTYLHTVSYLDDNQLLSTNKKAAECQSLVDNLKWDNSTTCWGEIEDLISEFTNGVSWYNVLKQSRVDDWSKKNLLSSKTGDKRSLLQHRQFERHVGSLQTDTVSNLMNGQMRKKFGIIPDKVRFGDQSGGLFNKLWADFMAPNFDTVDNLLNRGVNVTILSGQLDLICNTLGVELWINRLQWSGRDSFLNSPKKNFPADNSDFYGFVKQFKNLKMFYMLRAGHRVAHDAPWGTLEVVKNIVSKKD